MPPLQITSTLDFFEFGIEGQLFRRPKARKRNNMIQVGAENTTLVMRILDRTAPGGPLLRHKGCTPHGFRWVPLPNKECPFPEDVAVTAMQPSPTTQAAPSTTTAYFAPYPAQQVTRRIQSAVSTTASTHEYKYYSWTDVVNREWSNAFLICAGATCALMTALVIFGLASWMYLLTKPSDAATLYRVDTPISVF